MENKISVVINTYNAEKFLVRVLESVKDFDEIVVCDMESTDSTIEISKRYGAKIVVFPRGKYNIVEHARQTAIDAATYDWVLVLDADEVVPATLFSHLYKLINKEGGADADAYYIPLRNYFLGRFMRCHYPNHILRFFRRDKAYWPPIIHAKPEIKGKVARIPAKKELSMEHLANDSVQIILEKTNRYTDNELPKKGIHKYGLLSLLYRPFWRFFKLYIMKGAILDGKAGFMKALLEGNYQFALIMKMVEAQILEKNKKK